MSADLNRDYWEKILEEANEKALQHLKEENQNLAIYEYLRCARAELELSKTEITPEIVAKRRKNAKTFSNYAKMLERGEKLPFQVQEELEGAPRSADYDSLLRDVQAMKVKTGVKWDDVAGLKKIKDTLQETVNSLKLGNEAVLPDGTMVYIEIPYITAVLLYGPPGTGKTHLARAISNSLGATFYDAGFAGILSKYVGDTAKILRYLYTDARANAPSVIFLDEIDKITKKTDDSSSAYRTLAGALQTELEGLKSTFDTDKYVLTLAATNEPWDIPDALVSRFEKLVYIPLPGAKTRKEIIEILFRRYKVPLDPVVFRTEKGNETRNYEEMFLVKKADGASGRDLRGLCKEAYAIMRREMNPGIIGDDEITKDFRWKIRPVNRSDFEKAMLDWRPKASREKEENYEKWGKRFGKS